MKTDFHTLLVQLSDSIHRIDVWACCADSKVEIVGTSIHKRQANATIADAIRLASTLPKPRRRKIWLLTAEAWVGTIELEQDIVPQLDSTMLLPALALEAEYDSGFLGSDSQLAVERIDGATPIWAATQVPNAVVAEIREQSRQLGCHVSHITALPRELDDANSPDGPGSLDEQAVESAVVAFLREQVGPSSSSPPVVLGDTLRNRRIANVAYAIAAAIVLMICLGLYQQTQQATMASASEIAELQLQSKRFDALQTQLTQTLQSREDFRSTAAAESARRQQLVANRRSKAAELVEKGNAVKQLLDAMQIAADDNVWVASFEFTSTNDFPKTEIIGLATTPMQVTLFAAAVNDTLNRNQSRWKVSVESILAEDVVTSFKLSVVKRAHSIETLVPAKAASDGKQQASTHRWPFAGGRFG